MSRARLSRLPLLWSRRSPKKVLDLKLTSTSSMRLEGKQVIYGEESMNERLVYEKPGASALLMAVVLIATFTLGALMLLQRTNLVRAAGREQTMIETSSFYCNLKALGTEERERHRQLTREIQQARVETIELANGFAFRFQEGTMSLAELAEWVSAERKCCPFFDFEIELQADDGPLWLKTARQRGSKGVHARRIPHSLTPGTNQSWRHRS